MFIEIAFKLSIFNEKKIFQLQLGVEIRRVPSPNDHPSFIKGMAQLVKDHLDSNRSFNGQLLTRCPKCPRQSCSDARKWLEAVKW